MSRNYPRARLLHTLTFSHSVRVFVCLRIVGVLRLPLALALALAGPLLEFHVLVLANELLLHDQLLLQQVQAVDLLLRIVIDARQLAHTFPSHVEALLQLKDL